MYIRSRKSDIGENVMAKISLCAVYYIVEAKARLADIAEVSEAKRLIYWDSSL